VPGPPDEDDDDVRSPIEPTRARLKEKSAGEHITRQPDRRLEDRRGLGFKSRRKDDTELNRQVRAFLSNHICQLPEETLRLWIDGLWLGTATEAQLAVLVELAQRQRAADSAAPPTKTRGRPPAAPSLFDEERATWRALTDELKPFSRDRENHFNPSNRRGASGQRLADFRRKCRESPIGQRVARAGLFDTFFDDQALGPGPMAARLMHREQRRYLAKLEHVERVKAATAGSQIGRDLSRRRADLAAKVLKRFPTWRAFYDRLRQPR
jgi:hypothetical protein